MEKYYTDEQKKQLIPENEIQPVQKQIEYLIEQPTKLKMFLRNPQNQKIEQAVNVAIADANTKLNELKNQFTELSYDKLVIGGKRTKRAKTSNRKTKNKRKKLHKRN